MTDYELPYQCKQMTREEMLEDHNMLLCTVVEELIIKLRDMAKAVVYVSEAHDSFRYEAISCLEWTDNLIPRLRKLGVMIDD